MFTFECEHGGQLVLLYDIILGHYYCHYYHHHKCCYFALLCLPLSVSTVGSLSSSMTSYLDITIVIIIIISVVILHCYVYL